MSAVALVNLCWTIVLFKKLNSVMVMRSGSWISFVLSELFFYNRISKVVDVASSVPQSMCIIKVALVMLGMKSSLSNIMILTLPRTPATGVFCWPLLVNLKSTTAE